uniref:Cytochrome b561 domain-containing protein n=1 Tax=Elaeophora elaphi TaxID=1147741 RepID=A0A0R3S3K5_9BILA
MYVIGVLIIAILFAIIGLTQLRLFWFLYTGWRYKSFFLLRLHFILSLFCIVVLFTLSVIIGFMDIYVIGPFHYASLRNYFHSHVLVALCSLVPFIIGFNGSWRFYWELKNEICKPESRPEFLFPRRIANYQRY